MRIRQSVTHLPVEAIVASPSTVRAQLGNIDELVATIRDHGLVSPVTVTESPDHPGKFQILLGRRRLAAALVAGLDVVPAIVRHGLGANHVEQLLLTLADDAAEPLGAAVRGSLVQALVLHNVGLPEIARRTGIAPPTLSWLLSLCDVDTGVLDAPDADQELKADPPVPASTYFNAEHPCADAAASRCRHRAGSRIGGIACGPCWERALVAEHTAPAAQVDESAITRAVNGDRSVRLGAAEKLEAVRRLDGQGHHTAPEIARHLGISLKTVYRARETLASRESSATG